jgi:hypothetical protein
VGCAGSAVFTSGQQDWTLRLLYEGCEKEDGQGVGNKLTEPVEREERER